MTYLCFLSVFIGTDGLYLNCVNFSSPEWVINTINLANEFTESKLVVRAMTTIPTRKEIPDIFKAIAYLNKNLKIEKWRITWKRFWGAAKYIIYMRMDKQSFETIAKQGLCINWLLGTIKLTLERHGKKSKVGSHSSHQRWRYLKIPMEVSSLITI